MQVFRQKLKMHRETVLPEFPRDEDPLAHHPCPSVCGLVFHTAQSSRTSKSPNGLMCTLALLQPLLGNACLFYWFKKNTGKSQCWWG